MIATSSSRTELTGTTGASATVFATATAFSASARRAPFANASALPATSTNPVVVRPLAVTTIPSRSRSNLRPPPPTTAPPISPSTASTQPNTPRSARVSVPAFASESTAITVCATRRSRLSSAADNAFSCAAPQRPFVSLTLNAITARAPAPSAAPPPASNINAAAPVMTSFPSAPMHPLSPSTHAAASCPITKSRRTRWTACSGSSFRVSWNRHPAIQPVCPFNSSAIARTPSASIAPPSKITTNRARSGARFFRAPRSTVITRRCASASGVAGSVSDPTSTPRLRTS